MNQPFVSVVVPTCNRLPQLERLLAALGRQDYPADRYEVIVVDDGSKDGTAEWLGAEKDRWLGPLRPISQPNRGPAAARNRGIAASRGDIVALIDDDCVPAVDWLSGLLSGFTALEIGGVGGRVEGANSQTLVEAYLREVLYTALETTNGQVVYLYTGNAAFRREAVQAVGGFTEALHHPGGEDTDLGLRLTAAGYKLKYQPKAIVWHHHRSSLPGLWRMFFYYGQGTYYCHHRHGYPPLNWSVYVRIFSVLWWPVSVVRRLREGRGLIKSIAYPILRSIRDIAYAWGILIGRRRYGA